MPKPTKLLLEIVGFWNRGIIAPNRGPTRYFAGELSYSNVDRGGAGFNVPTFMGLGGWLQYFIYLYDNDTVEYYLQRARQQNSESARDLEQ